MRPEAEASGYLIVRFFESLGGLKESGSLSANAHVRRKERAEHGAPGLCCYGREAGPSLRSG